MAYPLWVPGLAILSTALIFRIFFLYTRNIALAKRSGLPYVCMPFNQAHPLWLVTNRLLSPWIRLLPRSWTYPWIIFLQPDFVWVGKYELFKDCGGDIILLVSPFHLQVCVGNPEAIDQICTRTDDFPKDLKMYERLELFGPNIVTAEGRLWRYHRKLISSYFNEKAIAVVWKESINRAQTMIEGWTRKDAQDLDVVWNLADDLTTLSLQVIAKVGFGMRLSWAHEEQIAIPEGHSMSYEKALELVLNNVELILVLPQWLLSRIPSKKVKQTGEAFTEWTRYLREMYLHKMQDLKSGELPTGQNVVESLIEGLDGNASSSDQQALGADEIMSNIFVLMLAGHETTANAMYFSALMLAMHPESQERLQKDLDEIFRDVPVAEWDFRTYSPALYDGMCAAVVNEALRLVPPILGIPKTTPADRDVSLDIDGQKFIVPRGVTIMLHPSIAGSNPRYWPHMDEADLNRFRPERWLLGSTGRRPDAVATGTAHRSDQFVASDERTDDDGDDTQPETSTALFRPAKGAYIPFSGGQRSCIGRRFAQVEAQVVLAFIFKHWSVELDVGLWMSDEELRVASAEEKREAWLKAKARAEDLLANGMWTIISLQMRAGRVPLKFVRRSHEAFRGAV